jgi:hypothetical protein
MAPLYFHDCRILVLALMFSTGVLLQLLVSPQCIYLKGHRLPHEDAVGMAAGNSSSGSRADDSDGSNQGKGVF